MSFVGPRPLLVKYLDLYNDHQKKRHRVRPGLTGLAQVNGRNAISWDEKFNLDIKYVEKVRFWTDIRIVLKTIIVVFKKSGVSSNTSVTMEEFKGND
jgi:lipopolysaccharide/colanic/teichoic acid biosynthesis glycosyltransferase